MRGNYNYENFNDHGRVVLPYQEMRGNYNNYFHNAGGNDSFTIPRNAREL